MTGMISTGTEALDSRLGGLREGGRIVVTGPTGSGKTLLALHFLLAGIEREERCLLVTRGEEALDSQAAFLGHTGPLSASPHLRVLSLRRSGPRDTSPEIVGVPALERLLRREAFARIVVDDLDSLVGSASSPDRAAGELEHLLRNSGATSYLLASTSPEHALDEYLDSLVQSACAVLRLDAVGRGRRRFSFLAVRQRAYSTEPFLYSLREGGGFAEDLPAYEREVDEAVRDRVVVLDETGAVPGEVLTALRDEREVTVHRELESSLGEVLSGRYGALLLGVDPYDPERTLNLAYTVRKSGEGAAIVFVSPSRGLRSMTRAQAFRIGGDDFLLNELPPAELITRVRLATARGHARRPEAPSQRRHLQPTEAGRPRPMDAYELRRVLRDLGEEAPSPFFAVATVESEADPYELWNALRPQLRLGEGDLVAVVPGALILVIAHVDAALAGKVLARVRATHPALADAATELRVSPLEGEEIRRWVDGLVIGEDHREAAGGM